MTPQPGLYIGPEQLKRHRPQWDSKGYMVRLTSYSHAYGPHDPETTTLRTSYA